MWSWGGRRVKLPVGRPARSYWSLPRPRGQSRGKATMYNTILLAVALQRWERYSVHALAARDVAAALARTTSKRLYILSAYEYAYRRAPAELSPTLTARFQQEEIRRTDTLMVDKLDAYVAPLMAEDIAVAKILRVG